MSLAEVGLTPLEERIARIVSTHERDRSNLIVLLQRVQEELGYLPPEAFPLIARHLRVSPSEVFGAASFYAQFRYQPSARHQVKVCCGTACYVRGGQKILDAVSEELKLSPGETNPNLRFGLEAVACFGACSLSPVMVIDKTVYGRLISSKAKEILKNLD